MPPCNCHGNTVPAGMTPPAGMVAPPGPPPPPPPPPTHSIRKGLQSFTLTAGGKTQTFGSKLEAQAERARTFGGRGTITPN